MSTVLVEGEGVVTTQVRQVLVAVTVLVSLSACGPSAPPVGPASSSAEDSTAGSGETSASTSTGGGGGTTGGGTTGADQTIAYVPWGPGDPPIPEQYAALAASRTVAPRCDDATKALPGAPFWATAAAVCRALTTNAAWPASTTVPAPPTPENAFQACLDDELTAMLRRALRWHADHPGQSPKVSLPDTSTRSPCQSRIYRASVPAADPSSVEPPVGMVPVAITASGIDNDFQVAVTVDGKPAEITFDVSVDDPGTGLRTVVVYTPAPPKRRTVKVAMSTARGTLTATVDLPGGGGSTTSSGGASSDATSSGPGS